MLKVTALFKAFATPQGVVHGVDGVSFDVPEGGCYALLGPSGCGKTTTLRCVAGLEQADGGRIEIGGRVVSDTAAGVFVPVHERPIGMVFQSYAIWPHLDVFENVAYPLRVGRLRPSRAELKSRVTEVLALVGMEEMARRPAMRLSGGQQQRVALARAIVRRPVLLLLDEPLSNLDARLRDAMRNELSTMIKHIGITALYVTHDQAEAFSLANRIAVMNKGRIVQEGEPRVLYAGPRTPFVATFLGAANILAGRVESRDDAGNAIVAVDGVAQRLSCETEALPGESVDLVLRPEDLAISTALPTVQLDTIKGCVAEVSFQGGRVECVIQIADGLILRALAHPTAELREGASVWVAVDPQRCTVLRKRREVSQLNS